MSVGGFKTRARTPHKRGIAACIALVIAAASMSSRCSLCSSDVLGHEDSPLHRNRAYVVQEDCGATTDFATQVTLVHGQNQPKIAWNKSVMDEGTVFRVQGRAQIVLTWSSEDSVTIEYGLETNADQVFRKNSSWDGITVLYRSK
jgi:hypothetical protein